MDNSSVRKRELHDAEDRCFDKVIAYNDLYTLKRVEIPFEGSTIAGILHLPKDVNKPAVRHIRARHGHDERGLPQRPEQCVRPAWHGLPLDRRAGTGREQSSWNPVAAGHLRKSAHRGARCSREARRHRQWQREFVGAFARRLLFRARRCRQSEVQSARLHDRALRSSRPVLHDGAAELPALFHVHGGH